MNNLAAHTIVALTYFRLGLVTVVLFGLAIQFQPKGRAALDKRANLASVLAAACYAGFIVYASLSPISAGASSLDATFRSGRPVIWPLAVLEWSVFFATVLWFAVIALARRR